MQEVELTNFEAMGNEKFILPHPSRNDVVRAELRPKESGFRPTPRQMLGRFHLSNILHELFPNSIPQVLAVNIKGQSSFDMRRFETDSEHNFVKRVRKLREIGRAVSDDELNKAKELIQKRQQDSAVQSFVAELRNLGVTVDPNGDNYSYDAAGNLQYLDNSFRPWQINRVNYTLVKCYNDEKLELALNRLEPRSRQQAQRHLNKLKELFIQEQNKISEHPEQYKNLTN